MKSINERVYELLLQQKEAITLSQLAGSKDLAGVPRMVLSQTVRKLSAEGLVAHRIINGKMFFSTDLNYGEIMNPSQRNLHDLDRMNTGLAALIGGDLSQAVLSMLTKNVDVDEPYDKSLDKITYHKKNRISLDEKIGIMIPDSFHYELKPDENHLVVAWSDESDNKDEAKIRMSLKIAHAFDESVNIRVINSCTKNLAWEMHEKMGKNTPMPYDIGEMWKASLLFLGDNTMGFLGYPSGIIIARMDWSDENVKHTVSGAIKVLGDWINTFECSEKPEEDDPLCPDAYDSAKDLPCLIETLQEAASNQSKIRDMTAKNANCISSYLQSGENRSLTKMACKVRNELEAEVYSETSRLTNVLEIIKKSVTWDAESEQRGELAKNAATFAGTTTRKITLVGKQSNIGSYNSQIDLSLGKGQSDSIEIIVINPLVKDIYSELQKWNFKGSNKEETEKILKALGAVIVEFEQKNNSKESYLLDYKMEGTVLAAYLGNEKTVNVPQGVTEIGDNSFAGADTIKEIILVNV